MTGRPLKTPETRINNHPPARGEWVDLQPLDEPVLPAYPIDWYRSAIKPFAVPKQTWDLWRQDPVTSQWAPADIALVLELGQRYWRHKDTDRLRIMTYLGLNAKGRRDLRWREPVETASAEKANAHAAEVRRLRIVSARDEAEQE
jgi:hypothetical protein